MIYSTVQVRFNDSSSLGSKYIQYIKRHNEIKNSQMNLKDSNSQMYVYILQSVYIKRIWKVYSMYQVYFVTKFVHNKSVGRNDRNF